MFLIRHNIAACVYKFIYICVLFDVYVNLCSSVKQTSSFQPGSCELLISIIMGSYIPMGSWLLKLGKSCTNGMDCEVYNLCCFTDVAIGAPKEDNYIGAVYIYHGDANGIVPRYSMVCDTIVQDTYLKSVSQGLEKEIILRDLFMGSLIIALHAFLNPDLKLASPKVY